MPSDLRFRSSSMISGDHALSVFHGAGICLRQSFDSRTLIIPLVLPMWRHRHSFDRTRRPSRGDSHAWPRGRARSPRHLGRRPPRVLSAEVPGTVARPASSRSVGSSQLNTYTRCCFRSLLLTFWGGVWCASSAETSETFSISPRRVARPPLSQIILQPRPALMPRASGITPLVESPGISP